MRRKVGPLLVALSVATAPLDGSPAEASATWPGGTIQVCKNIPDGCDPVASGPSSGTTVKIVLESWRSVLPDLNPDNNAVSVYLWWLKAEPDYQDSGDCRQGLAPTPRTLLGSVTTSTAGSAVLAPVTLPPSGSASAGPYWVCATTAAAVGDAGHSSVAAQPFLVT